MARPRKQVEENLIDTLSSLQGIEESETQPTIEVAGETENTPSEIETLLAEVQALRAERDALKASNKQAEKPSHEDYDLVTVYVPYNAKGISKNNGYDAETGESFVYTIVKVAHKPEGEEHHRMETYNIRLDSRVVVPRFIAKALGDRADIQEYVESEWE